MNDIDIEHLKKWTEEFGVKPELAEYAFRCNEYRGNITMQNVEDTLSEWYATGIVEVSEASKYEKEKATDNKNRYARKTGKKSAYRTGKEAGITDEEMNSVKAKFDASYEYSLINFSLYSPPIKLYAV